MPFTEVRPRTQKIVLGLLVCVLAFTAGCSAIQGSESSSATTPKIANQDDVNHAIVVEILDGESVVYSDGRTVEGESNVDLGSFDGTGEYQVKVTVDGSSTVRTYTFEDGDAVTTIGIDNDGGVTVGT